MQGTGIRRKSTSIGVAPSSSPLDTSDDVDSTTDSSNDSAIDSAIDSSGGGEPSVDSAADFVGRSIAERDSRILEVSALDDCRDC